MTDRVLEEFQALDREALMERLIRELPIITGEMEMTPSSIAWRTGLDSDRFDLVVSGKRKMKWSEYMSILFFLWGDEKGRKQVEERGFFPEALKNAMAMKRNEHNE